MMMMMMMVIINLLGHTRAVGTRFRGARSIDINHVYVCFIYAAIYIFDTLSTLENIA
jgi:hypothetical protein